MYDTETKFDIKVGAYESICLNCPTPNKRCAGTCEHLREKVKELKEQRIKKNNKVIQRKDL